MPTSIAEYETEITRLDREIDEKTAEADREEPEIDMYFRMNRTEVRSMGTAETRTRWEIEKLVDLRDQYQTELENLYDAAGE